MIERLLDIDLNTAPYGVVEREWGNAHGDERTVTYTVEAKGTTQDAALGYIAALLSRLPSALGRPVPFVIQATGSTAPVELLVTETVSVSQTYTIAQDIGYLAEVSFSVKVRRMATRANRVFLANPIGDEWPDSDEVVRSDATKVYADGGRWCMSGASGDVVDLDLHFDTVDDELLVIEFVYDVVACAGAFRVEVHLPTGAASTYEWDVVSGVTALGRGRYVGALRVPTSTAKHGYLRFHTTSTTKVYVSDVHVGVKTVAHERVLPGAPSSVESTLPYGWSAETQTGCAWTYASGKFTLTIATNAAAACCLAYGTQGVAYATHAAAGTAGMQPVVGGRRYGWRGKLAVTAYTDGTLAYEVAWYDSTGAYISASTLTSKTATYSETTLYGEVTAPAGAAWACPLLGVTAGATLTATLCDVDFGEHIMEAPASMHLSRISGEVPAALHLIVDADIESDAHLYAASVGPDDGQPDYIEAEAMTTTAGGATVWGDDQYGAPAHGSYFCAFDSAETGYANVSAYARRTYQLFGKLDMSSSSTGTVQVMGGNAIPVTTTVLAYEELGQVLIPPTHALPGVGSYLVVTVTPPGSPITMNADVFVLLPLPALIYHPDDGATAVSAIELDEDGNVFLDGVADYTDLVDSRLEATGSDVLHVLADRNNAAVEPTHLVYHEVYALERTSLWRAG